MRERNVKLVRGGIISLLLVLSFSATAVLGLHDAVNAAPILVDTRAGLGETDFIDWGVLGPSTTLVNSPFTISSNGGSTSATVSMPNGTFQRQDQGNTWNGNFAPGDHLLWTQGNTGPVTIGFANPVIGAGAQIQDENPGPFTATLDVFDPSNTRIGTFTLTTGNSTSAADNSAIFLGVRDDSGANIGSIAYSVSGFTGGEGFAINNLSLNQSLSQVPEPSTLALLGSGLPAFVIARRRARKRPLTPTGLHRVI